MSGASVKHADEIDHALSACRNCGFSFALLASERVSFCPRCSQDTHPHAPSAWEFFHEFITHYVALEGKLWKSLALLFFKPGELSLQFRAGKKVRYLAPLRLYITASFLFFLVVKVAGFGNIVQVSATSPTNQAGPVSKGLSIKTTPATLPPLASVSGPAPDDLKLAVRTDLGCAPNSPLCERLQAHLESKWKNKTTADVIEALKSGVIANLPYAMFFMLPVFAFITQRIYWRRNIVFGEHMVYAMHVHAFAFFALLAKATLPRVAGDIVFALSIVYYWVAMQRYFGGRWWATGLRFAFVGMLYPVLLVALTSGVVLLSLMV